VTVTVLLVVSIALVGLCAVEFVLRRRRQATMACAVRQAVLAELERDPALAGLQLRLGTRAPWNGQIVVEIAGVVQSPWYRYAVMRATQRAVARTFRNARLDDRVVVDSRNGHAVRARRSA
jgi:hypothetical protein